MLSRFCFLIATSAIALGGSQGPVSANSEQADDLVLVVTASYPGADAQVVADTIAAPIEQQINGVEGMVRIESKSGNDGEYIAHLYFQAKTDPKLAAMLVQNRVSLAKPILPEVVQTTGVSVKVGKAESDRNEVAIIVTDRQDQGWKALEEVAGFVVKRLAKEGAVIKPQAYPQEEEQVFIQIDREQCRLRGVALPDVYTAMEAAGSAARVDRLKKVMVRDKIPLTAIATIKVVTGPAAIYRVNLYPAIRITGAPPAGESVASVSARCVEWAEAEIKGRNIEGFVVENLSPK
jgi:multidrug efflux pump subunit AcrB